MGEHLYLLRAIADGVGSLNGPAAGALDALALLMLFSIKHFICDFVLQTNWQASNKGQYGHPAGLVHVGIHGLGSAIVLVGAPIGALAAILAAEMAVHYHIDWAKMRVGALAGWTPAHSMFWIAIGFDQLLHFVTYLAMAGFLLFVS